MLKKKISSGFIQGVEWYSTCIRFVGKNFTFIKNKGSIILDEIESALHPDLVRKIIFLFENKTTNPHHAQLIFSAHLALLLKDRHKTQIFIMDKNKQTLEIEIYRLDEVEGVRNDDRS